LGVNKTSLNLCFQRVATFSAFLVGNNDQSKLTASEYKCVEKQKGN